MRRQEFASLYAMLQARIAKTPEAPFLRTKRNGVWHDTSWRTGGERIEAIMRGLAALGFKPDDKVNILGNTSDLWILTDLAIVGMGGICVPIYQSNTPEDCQYIIDNCEAKFVFAENAAQLKKLLAIRNQISNVAKVITFDGAGADGDWVLSWDEFLQRGAEVDAATVRAWSEAVKPDTLATFVYTSGTTGKPKGAMLTHGAFLAVTDSVAQVLDLSEQDLTLLYLPLAHIFARILEMGAIRSGYCIAICEGIDKIMDNLSEVRPTFFPSVPRIFEKAYAKIVSQAKAGGGVKAKIFDWAIGVGREVGRYRQRREAVPLGLRLQHRLADKLVYSKLKNRFGGRIKFFISGGAPLAKEIAEFFLAADLLILEGYGMTETTAVTNVNRPDAFKLGTVGPTVPYVEQKIADDGEILDRGPGMMVGYWKRPEATAEAIDADGWLHTGDIGEFDEDGFLRITDRKKDIIITAGGKNIAPQNLENLLKTTAPISQVMVYGDRRPYLVALVTLDPETAADYGAAQGVISAEEAAKLKEAAAALASPATTPEARAAAAKVRLELTTRLAADAKIKAWVDAAVAEVNRGLASYESIKKVHILPGDFSMEDGELTPTLKLKRKVVVERYQAQIDALYANTKD